ncbi:MAG: GTPase ObgE [Acidimicrobiales bacterium]
MSEFVDEALMNVRGGDGGAGSVSFRREAHTPKGGPDGGDGGRGGNVWLVADHQVASLLAFQDHPHRRAESGTHGMGKARHGSAGADLRVAVPEGTVISDRDGIVLADLVHTGDEWLAAAGGRGGRGNARFLSNRRRAPSFAEQGEAGEERWVRLELKLMADVALVGFPNAGKSTLISRVSAAKPKVADYPFTTLRPHLGVVREDGHEFVVADIPGLIEGASEGRGLGHQFLRHVERASTLVILLDLGPTAERPPQEQLEVLLDELGRYEPDLVERPRLVVGTKADVATGEAPISTDLSISAVTGAGVPDLVRRMAVLVAEARAARAATRAGHQHYVVHRPVAEGVRVEREASGELVVHGREAERAVALNDLTDVQALAHVQDRLRRLGVDRALVRAGAREGDVVRVGAFSFEYREDC